MVRAEPFFQVCIHFCWMLVEVALLLHARQKPSYVSPFVADWMLNIKNHSIQPSQGLSLCTCLAAIWAKSTRRISTYNIWICTIDNKFFCNHTPALYSTVVVYCIHVDGGTQETTQTWVNLARCWSARGPPIIKSRFHWIISPMLIWWPSFFVRGRKSRHSGFQHGVGTDCIPFQITGFLPHLQYWWPSFCFFTLLP